MVNLVLPIRVFKARFKIRYPILMIVFISLTLLIPYFIPYDEDWRPQRSVENTGAYGHSVLRERTESQFNVVLEHRDITQTEVGQNKVIVIIAPQITFTSTEVDFLKEWTNPKNGGHLIILDNSKHTEPIFREFDIHVNHQEGPIYDINSGFGNPGFVPMQFKEIASPIFIAVKPSSFTFIEGISASTVNAAESETCIRTRGEGCFQEFDVGMISSNIAVVLDEWMVSNDFIEPLSQNLGLLDFLISSLSTGIDTVIFDESHHKWAPLNKKGVEVLFSNIRKSDYLLPIIILFAVGIPVILGIYSGILSGPKRQNILSQKLTDRIDNLYLDKIIAAPLSLEEQFLTVEKLELEQRSAYYFQYIANKLLDHIHRKKIEEKIGKDLMMGLNFMKDDGLSSDVAWELIKETNRAIEIALQPKQYRNTNNII